MASRWFACIMLLTLIASQHIVCTEGAGVNYGMLGNDIPSPKDVVALYKKYAITKMRLFKPDQEVQEALQSSGIDVALGVRNEDLAQLAGSPDAAMAWVNTNVVPYKGVSLQFVTVGNEAIPGENSQYVAPAMKNLRDALNSIQNYGVGVTTVVSSQVLGISYPPSQGAFSNETLNDMTSIIAFLANLRPENPQRVLMVNVYPYFAYAADPSHISLAYAQFLPVADVVKDGDLEYKNLFDASVDAFHSAMEKVGGADVKIALAESGWPSAGNGEFTTPQLAQTYNQNLMNHVANSGTPKRPNDNIDVFIFAMFNENQKPGGVEQNFGLFYPSGEPIYPLTFVSN